VLSILSEHGLSMIQHCVLLVYSLQQCSIEYLKNPQTRNGAFPLALMWTQLKAA